MKVRFGLGWGKIRRENVNNYPSRDARRCYQRRFVWNLEVLGFIRNPFLRCDGRRRDAQSVVLTSGSVASLCLSSLHLTSGIGLAAIGVATLGVDLTTPHLTVFVKLF